MSRGPHKKNIPVENHRTKNICVRLTDAGFAKVTEQAAERGLGVCEHIRDLLRQAASGELELQPPVKLPISQPQLFR